MTLRTESRRQLKRSCSRKDLQSAIKCRSDFWFKQREHSGEGGSSLFGKITSNRKSVIYIASCEYSMRLQKNKH